MDGHTLNWNGEGGQETCVLGEEVVGVGGCVRLRWSAAGMLSVSSARLRCVRTLWAVSGRHPAPRLKVGTHCISRSFPLLLQCMLASLTAHQNNDNTPSRGGCRPRVTCTPSRVQAAAQLHTRTMTIHLTTETLFCVPAVAQCPPPWASQQSRSARLHHMRVAGNTLEASYCRTCHR